MWLIHFKEDESLKQIGILTVLYKHNVAKKFGSLQYRVTVSLVLASGNVRFLEVNLFHRASFGKYAKDISIT